MSDTLTGDDRRNYIVEILGAKYPDRICRSDIKRIVPDNWTDNNLDNALHVLKKRCIVSKTFDGYQLVTAPDSYNQKLIAEANAGGAKAPEPVKGVSSLDMKPLLSKREHKVDKKAAQVPPPKLCSHHHCTTAVPAGVEYCDTCKATLSGTTVEPAALVPTHCDHGEPIGGCIHPNCVKDFVRPKPVEKGSDQTKTPAQIIVKCVHCRQPITPEVDHTCAGVAAAKCVDCGSKLTPDEVKYYGNTCNACEETILTDQTAEQASELKAVMSTTKEEAKFCRADIDAALKDLEKQLAERPPVEDLELKLDLLADFERMFDARLKPILSAIAVDLQR